MEVKTGLLATWDVLFLIPTAWLAPVWAPLVVSGTLLLTGLGMLTRRRPAGSSPDAAKRRRRRGRPVAWLGIGAGASLVLASFFLRTGEAFGCFHPLWMSRRPVRDCPTGSGLLRLFCEGA